MKSNNFDAIAQYYDRLAKWVFGDQIKKAQTHFLDKLPKEGKILVIGGGTGWILREIGAISPALQIDYIEASEKMLALARREVGESGNVSFIHGTQEDIPETTYDAIITHFFLDVFREEDLGAVMGRLKSHLKDGAVWLCADFQRTGKWRHSLLIWIMHRFFRLFSGLQANRLVDFSNYFEQSGLELTAAQEFSNGLIFSRVYRPS